MRISFLSIFLICVLSFSSFANLTKIKRLEWIDPKGRQPTTYSDWKQMFPEKSEVTSIGTVYKKGEKNRQNLVNVIVNKSIFANIKTEIDTFVNDLVNAGYAVQLDTIIGMSDTELRNHLAGLADVAGAIFVGELPVAWFDWGEEFPHDLYFCDLNGTYTDSDMDGIYDNHTGNKAPEIWVGRIYTRNLTWDNEISLLKNYFHKNHLYRTTGSSLPQRALCFIDDDWSSWTTCGLDSIYSNVVVVNNDYQTIASNYRNELAEGYEWIQICAHSSPWGHTFKYPFDNYRGTVFNYEIFTLETSALFYNLFACSGTRFTEENGSAGWYLFCDPYGLLAVGSTKTGSMLYFEDFYDPIGDGQCIGDAFKHWFTIWAEVGAHGWTWDWFYGLNILGDPTLKPKNQVTVGNDLFTETNKCMSLRVNERAQTPIPNWEPPEIVATDPESDAFPKITTNSDGKVWVIWESGRSYTNGRSEIYSAYRDESGWSAALNVGPFIYWDYCPDIDRDNLNRPVAVWSGWDDTEYQYDILYSVYDGSWSTRHLAVPINPAFDLKPTLLRDNTNLLRVAWESRRDLNLNIYTCFYNGTSWSSTQQVTTNPANEASPKMAVDSLGKPWIFYSRRYEDRAEIWGSFYTGSQWLESGPISGVQKGAYHPTSAVDEEGNIWVAWQSSENGNSDIYASYFSGSSWSPVVQICSSPEGDLFPDMTTDNTGAIWLVYQSKSDMDWNIYSSYCDDVTWTTPEIVANFIGADINPQIACNNENELWVCWQSYSTGNWEVMVSHRQGSVITEEEERFIASNFNVSPTLFSKRLHITTEKPYQKIKIYDVKGSLIQTISSNKKRIAYWTPINIPPGIYFVVISGKDKCLPKKVTLLK